jgi:hypothetical protein
MAIMADDDTTSSTPPEEDPASARTQEPGIDQEDEDPGYLIMTGEAAGEDGSVVPIIGGLPAVEGSAWDTGAASEDRGGDLAGKQDSRADQDSGEDTAP